MAAARVHGSCLCGGLRITAHLPSKWVAHCHCTYCRRAHGAPFVTWAGFPTDSVQIDPQGLEPTWYDSSPGARRGFCPRCGSPMLFRSERWPDEMHVARALITGPLDREPSAHVFFDTHVPWLDVNDSLPRRVPQGTPPPSNAQARPRLAAEEVSAEWLAAALGEPVEGFTVKAQDGRCSHQWQIDVRLAGGRQRALRLKACPGSSFGRSELDYYTRDYVDMADPPLVRCHDAAFVPGQGYHLLLDDLSASHHNADDPPPTLDYGLAVAHTLGRLHAHHWHSQGAPAASVLQRYLAQARPGLPAIEQATGLHLRGDWSRLEQALPARWADPRGMTLLHGDLNPGNILVPRTGRAPLYFLDRQPFEWSLTYGLALSDLAYWLIPWWPEALRRQHEAALLRAWHQALAPADYPWARVQADWALCCAQCLFVPVEWCASPETLDTMRWLWEAQLDRVRAAMADHPLP